MNLLKIGFNATFFVTALTHACAGSEPVRITVTIDRGHDLGQSFGSLFEATSDNASLIVGAGFQNAYNTRYRGDRHAVQFFIRPAGGDREMTVQELPRSNFTLTGSYLFGRDGLVYSGFGGLKTWNPKSRTWQGSGSSHETMRVGNSTLTFAGSKVLFDGRTILEPPEEGSYQLFFYAHGHLCFYHVNRRGKPYHLYVSDEDGFSRLYACPWTPQQPRVDLSKAVTLRLPVVGETTFAWGQLGRQVVTGSNIGGFYVFESGAWRTVRQPTLGRSFQLYSSVAFGDRLLMGQYPTGRLFEYDGKTLGEKSGWPPVLPGVSRSVREAQTTVVYGGDLFVGVWPWAEVWRYNPDSGRWMFMRRMFKHPALSDKISHPYEVENKNHPVLNLWGQRVTSLIPNGPDLFISTSSKGVDKWKPKEFPFLAPEKWKSYGKVYRATMPGHLAAATKWTEGPTTIEFLVRGTEIVIRQDGKRIGSATLTGSLAGKLAKVKALKNVKWGDGTYGRFAGKTIKGSIHRD
ncbi:MAG: NADH dehydrogenase [ubiquinone] 1 beta subcomplex subunit 3 [Planctomycetales bacterium]|nr:NADH dehydrogenase [ubiquinone] 1 beta subcomplex subunit 3 [Planctomycetales bacterium]